MTREEAIEVLKKNRPGADPRRCGLELCTAVDVAISALREQPQWIPVEERLPELFGAYLVAGKDGFVGAERCFVRYPLFCILLCH